MSGPRVYDALTPLLAQHPALRDAVPPVPVAVTGPAIDPARTKGWRVTDAWRSRLRESPDELVGPILVEGACMASIFPRVCAMWFDPTTPAVAGDIILLGAGDAAMRRLLSDGAKSPAWMAEYNNVPLANIWVKQLQRVNGHAYLVADDGAMALLDSRVLGVLRYFDPAPRIEHSVRRVSLDQLQAALR